MNFSKELAIKSFKYDFPASIIVFLVALPLCLGIALASGAPLFSGIIAGVIGGIVVASLSGSPLGVSGPAAGLVAIVLSAIATLESYEAFLTAVVLAGVIQLILGYIKAGMVGYYFPNSVIKGMLSGIGIIIILKQIPHLVGYDENYEGDLSFLGKGGENTFSEFFNTFSHLSLGATIVGLFGLLILILWETRFIKHIAIFKYIQAPLVVVTLGVLYVLATSSSEVFRINTINLVQIPVLSGLYEFKTLFIFPDFSILTDMQVYISAFTLAIVASLETLLCVEATDKQDPYKRVTPTNRELKAQGVGNICSGLIGGLPITQVIVRSSANIQSGGRTKMSAIYHGILLMIFAISIPKILNLIPLSALAAVLIMVGYKLTKPKFYVEMWRKGWTQFLPFVATILGILLTDLLVGIVIGMIVAVLFLLYANFRSSFFFDEEKYHKEEVIKIKLSQEVSFLNKASLMDALKNIPDGSDVEIDASECTFIDEDVKDVIRDFRDSCEIRNINLTIIRPIQNFHKIGISKFYNAIIDNQQ